LLALDLLKPPMRQKIAVLLYPGCIFFEVALAAETLAKSLELRFLTPDGEDHPSSIGGVIRSSGSYDDLLDLDVAAVLIPGGDPGSIIPPGRATAALRAACDRGAVMAGICAGGLVMASAGLLKGVRATHNYTAEFTTAEVVAFIAPHWDGVIYQRSDVVVDGRFITAMPWAYAKFAAAVAQSVGVMGEAEAASFVSYHRDGRLGWAASA
jgi:transcriptional regulator GlxA family with amidase domain